MSISKKTRLTVIAAFVATWMAIPAVTPVSAADLVAPSAPRAVATAVSSDLTDLTEWMEDHTPAEMVAITQRAGGGGLLLTGHDVRDNIRAGTMRFSDPSVMRVAAAAGIYCDKPDVRDPHSSSRARGVIAKAAVTCRLVNANRPGTISVTLNAAISYSTGRNVKAVVLLTESHSQNVSTNGTSKIFYIPREGSTAGTRRGVYTACATIQASGGNESLRDCATATPTIP